MWNLKLGQGGGAWPLKTIDNFVGRQHWEFEESEHDDVSAGDDIQSFRAQFAAQKYVRKHSSDLLTRHQLASQNPLSGPLPPPVNIAAVEDITAEAVETTLRRAVRYYSTIQADDGHWPCEYMGNQFIMPGMIIALYVTGAMNVMLSAEHKHEMLRHLYIHQNEDGGWGFHIEGHSCMIGTVLCYVSLRLLGEKLEDPQSMALEKARNWILKHGGATGTPSWGKFWLSVLGAYEWEGNNPLPPELWLLPYSLPIHPGRMYCHVRMIALPMSYVFGRRFVGEITPTVAQLRSELYNESYEDINWNAQRNNCAKEDLFYPHPLLQDLLWGTLHHVVEPILTSWPGSKLRSRALANVMKHVHYEDENTRYVCIGPVNKPLNLLACWIEDANSEAFKLHLGRVPDYLWVAEDGMKMKSYNGCQSWDAALAVEGLAATDLGDECTTAMTKAYHFLDKSQVRADCPGKIEDWHRHISKGGWTFSTQDQGWVVSDCTAEALKACLTVSKLPDSVVGEKIPDERIFDAVNLILSYKNPDGGSPSYETKRSYDWLELINPAETFGDDMLDYSCVECTSSCVQALVSFTKMYPEHRTNEIERYVQEGCEYIESIQLPDGSWYGSWGICYTYATWFAVVALVAGGRRYNTSPAIRAACSFLLSKQLEDGGWGESYLSSQNKVYTNLKGHRPHVAHTSWAMLALLAGDQADRNQEPLHRAAKVLINRQMGNGDFPQEEIVGSFFRTVLVSYSNYRNIFPIRALGEYRQKVFASKFKLNQE